MKSVKPGRASSVGNAIGNIIAILFGIGWTTFAASMGGGFFALFGVLFIIGAAANLVFNIKNATSKNRYSSFDITDEGEEPDPLNQCFSRHGKPTEQNLHTEFRSTQTLFCPYCGSPAKDGFAFCKNCGKPLPSEK
ncbi:MAG: zinc ribbon domain-containing protein [Oscillospiraceae bacterium]|jgi:hypothetical protein|nr:zinc ribbon domain-containing protein [Oscillospiraceae bacterium]